MDGALLVYGGTAVVGMVGGMVLGMRGEGRLGVAVVDVIFYLVVCARG